MADYILPPTLTDEISAVNSILRSIGEAPVDTLDEPQGLDAAKALSTLKQVDLAVQSEGWEWNREYALELSPDTNHEIPLPDNCLRIMQAYWAPTGTFHKVSERARKLYDRTAHSYQFEAAVTVDAILHLEWGEMPEAARGYITMRACQLFQGQEQTNQVVYQVQEQEVQMHRAILEQAEDEANPQNSITGNADVASRLYGRGLIRRT